MKVWFYLRDKNKEHSIIYCKVSHAGSAMRISTGINTAVKSWDQKAQKIGGNKFQLENDHLLGMSMTLKQIHSTMTLSRVGFSVRDIVSEFKGERITGADFTFVATADELIDHLTDMKKLKSCATLKYKRNNLQKFLTSAKLASYSLSEIKEKHGFDYIKWLLNTLNVDNDRVNRCLEFAKRVLNYAIRQGYLTKNPWLNIEKLTVQRNKRKVFLTQAEFKSLSLTDFKSKAVRRSAEIFLFCCYTGMSHADANAFRMSVHTFRNDGELWIRKKREKTACFFELPLFPEAMAIIDKHGGEKLITVRNDRHNNYLKQVGAIIELEFELCAHHGRKTFADTWLNINEFSEEAVAHMMGCSVSVLKSNYATVRSERVKNEMTHFLKKAS